MIVRYGRLHQLRDQRLRVPAGHSFLLCTPALASVTDSENKQPRLHSRHWQNFSAIWQNSGASTFVSGVSATTSLGKALVFPSFPTWQRRPPMVPHEGAGKYEKGEGEKHWSGQVCQSPAMISWASMRGARPCRRGYLKLKHSCSNRCCSL